ncbi:hypothetical protein OO014_05390 [Intrasporangium calvum]|uniref:Uncharacterized protein n=1 Tax=Intrasporangium calvum TaxID=53358 RepID=A0ABT5GEL0_9MICO|nr:hypothetical protein [Intrasporangium calvum]MDC5696682.1 hypothetical protein [Intrasporangium calvum]
MGLFLNAAFDGTSWTESDEVQEPSSLGNGLTVSVHDSDIVWVSYAPSGPGEGVAWLHLTARACFGDDSIPPTDPDREAAGLTEWLASNWDPAGEVDDLPEVVRGFVVGDDDRPEEGASPFAEETLVSFLRAVRLPVPPTLA